MNKGELIDAVAKKTELSKKDATEAVNAVLDIIKKNTKKGVQLVGFGSFAISRRKKRMGRNPQTGETIEIKASTTVKFKPGKEFKDTVSGK